MKSAAFEVRRSESDRRATSALRRWLVGWLLVAVAIALIICRVVVAAAPLTTQHPLAALASLGDLVLVGLTLMLGYCFGARALRLFELTMGRAERIASATALGLGLLAYCCLLLAFVGLYRPPLLIGAVLLSTLLLRNDLRHVADAFVRAGRDVRAQTAVSGRGAIGLALLIALTLFASALGALTPPHHFDALAYHLTAPARFLETGRLAPLPDVPYGNLPLTAELLYGVGLAFGSDAFAQLLHLAFGLLTALASWALARRSFDRATAWLAVALFLGTPLVTVWARVANIDLPLSCFLLLATLAVVRTGEVSAEGARRWAILAGVWGGLALGTKYQALFAVPILTLLLYVDAARARHGWREVLARLALFCGPVLLLAAPWYLKNWLLLANPLWPLFSGGQGFDRLAVDLTDYFARGMVISPRTALGYILLPLRVYTRGSIEAPLTILSPLYLLLPLLLLLPARRAIFYPLVMSAGIAIGWALGFQELRYLLPICAPLSLATATVLRAGLRRPVLRRAVMPALYLATLLGMGTTLLHVGADRSLAVIAGFESRDAYLRQNLATGPTYRATSFLGERLQPGDIVRFFDDAQVYYVPYRTETDHLDIALIRLMASSPSPGAALATLRTEGVTYLVVNEGNIRYREQFDPEGRLAAAHTAFTSVTPLLERVYQDGPDDRPRVVIYHVPSTVAAPQNLVRVGRQQ